MGSRRWAGACLAALVLALAGCASAPKPPADAVSGPWSGRLALQVQDRPSESFSAGFELKGSALAGELQLFSPIGGTLAVLDWQPGRARLQANSRTREFASVDALMTELSGAAIPVRALFDWLRGIATPVAGWQADLSQLAHGRIAAKRLDPLPEADLRVVLER
ncbi:lipoprotein insertase outer membrane protein LolB [Ramlibacter solisilvae]